MRKCKTLFMAVCAAASFAAHADVDYTHTLCNPLNMIKHKQHRFDQLGEDSRGIQRSMRSLRDLAVSQCPDELEAYEASLRADGVKHSMVRLTIEAEPATKDEVDAALKMSKRAEKEVGGKENKLPCMFPATDYYNAAARSLKYPGSPLVADEFHRMRNRAHSICKFK